MERKAGAIPVSMENLKLVKQRQLERSKEEGKILTLTEVSNEIVKKGLEPIIKEDIKKK